MARVTIVGGGYGGITAAKALDDVAEVTLVEQKDTFVSHAAALRAAVDRDWAEKIFLPYDRLLTNGRVVHGTVLTVRGATVEVSGHGQIEADYLVLATGTAYPFPAKHMESSSVIAKARIERVHTNLEQSSRALIVGAGAVGIELAGEITSAFPDVKVTMLEAADRILPAGDYKPEIREAISDQLAQRGVEIITGDSLSFLPPVDVGVLSPFRVTTENGRQLEADMWFRAYGSAAATGSSARTTTRCATTTARSVSMSTCEWWTTPVSGPLATSPTCASPSAPTPLGPTLESSPAISPTSSRVGSPPRPTRPEPNGSSCPWGPTAAPPRSCVTVCASSSAPRRPARSKERTSSWASSVRSWESIRRRDRARRGPATPFTCALCEG